VPFKYCQTSLACQWKSVFHVLCLCCFCVCLVFVLYVCLVYKVQCWIMGCQ
jgi:hypothetical protein